MRPGPQCGRTTPRYPVNEKLTAALDCEGGSVRSDAGLDHDQVHRATWNRSSTAPCEPRRFKRLAGYVVRQVSHGNAWRVAYTALPHLGDVPSAVPKSVSRVMIGSAGMWGNFQHAIISISRLRVAMAIFLLSATAVQAQQSARPYETARTGRRRPQCREGRAVLWCDRWMVADTMLHPSELGRSHGGWHRARVVTARMAGSSF